MKASQLAVDYFRQGDLLCAESVLMALCRSRSLESTLIPSIATGFCSGVGRTRGMCGALSGAVMALGVFTGRAAPGGEFARCYEHVQAFEELFRDKWGSVNCHDIIGVDFADPEDQKRFREQNLITKCFGVVEWTVDTVDELLK